ncbi:MAG: hypothetical protein R3B13_12425 [Polyangiaceae bacterium]
MTVSFRLACICAALAASSCTIVNDVDPCGAKTTEARVSEPSPELELISHPQAVAQIVDGRMLAAYLTHDQTNPTGLHLIAFNATSGVRVDACSEPDYLLSSDSPTNPTLVAADFMFGAQHIVAAVAWTSGSAGFFSRKVRYQLLDDRLCVVGPEGGVEMAPSLDTLTEDAALAWSPTESAVWATFHDTRTIYRTRIVNGLPTGSTPIVQGQLLIDNYRMTLAEDGRGLATWYASNDPSELLADRRHLRAVLLGPGLEPRKNALTGTAGVFEPSSPTPYRAPDLNNTLALAVRTDRYALAFDGIVAPNTRPIAHVLELDATDGRPRGKPWRVDPDSSEAHGKPAATYLPGDNLFVAWASPSGQGTVARLFQSGGRPRFTGVACGEARFAIGTRAPANDRGLLSMARTGNGVWVLHPAELGADHAVMAWRVESAELWPASN